MFRFFVHGFRLFLFLAEFQPLLLIKLFLLKGVFLFAVYDIDWFLCLMRQCRSGR